MIHRNTIVGCAAALGMDEKGSGCIFSTPMDNKQARLLGTLQ
jgi:hypothetical protein